MTRAEIQAFLAVVEYGSISRAADELFLRQSTLSGRIQTLENELNMVLFKRGKGVRSTELTDYGRDFVPIAEKWEQLWQETLSAANKRQNKALSVSAILSLNAYIMSEVYSLFAANNPSVRLRLLIRHSDDSYHLIESGGAEAAFVTKPQYSKKVDALPLFREKMMLVYNEAYPAGEALHPSELDANREVLLDWHREYVRWQEYWFGPTSSPRVYTDDMTLMEDFLEKESCWTVAPVSVARALTQKSNKIRTASLLDAPGDRTVFMLKRSMTAASEELNLLLSYMKEVVERQGAQWVYGA